MPFELVPTRHTLVRPTEGLIVVSVNTLNEHREVISSDFIMQFKLMVMRILNGKS